MGSVPSASADGSNTYLVSWALDPPAYAGGTDLMARIVHKKQNASAARKPRSHLLIDPRARLGLDEHDHQSKEDQRFDQGQAQNHHGLNLCCGSRISGCTLAGGRADSCLSERATNYRNRETDTCGQGL